MLNLDFNEKTHVERDKPEDVQQSQRTMFMNSVLHDLTKQRPANKIWRMNLTMSRPHEYAHDINQFILFSVSAGVECLEFNFNDPKWEQNGAILFCLPDAVYQQNKNLEYLELYWCNLDFTRFSSLRFLKTISLGFTIITDDQLRFLVSSCPILETLRLKRCVGMDRLRISEPNSMLKILVLDHCLNSHFLQIQGPKLIVFEYSGKVVQFLLENQIKVAVLDFSMQDKFERLGVHLFHLTRQLKDVNSMSVCSAFLQLIATEYLTVYTHLDLNLQYLNMNTALHSTEFIGIRFMLRSCSGMNTLNLCIVPRKMFDDYVAPIPFVFDPPNFWSWTTPRVETCLLHSLVVLNVRGFEGSSNEMCFIRYIIYYGRCLRLVQLFRVPVQEDDHAKREELETKCNLLKQSPKANPLLEISSGEHFL